MKLRSLILVLLLPLMNLTSVTSFAGAVDECIDSLASGKGQGKGCGKMASLTESTGRICQDNGVNCGALCERAPGGKCVVKGTLANVLKNGCRDGRNLSLADQDLCDSDEIKFVELK